MNLDCISVCICTFKRPAMLRRVLEGIIAQIIGPEFTVEIIVVDNDEKRSAENIVGEYKQAGRCKIIYDCEPEQSISLARNRTIRNASGGYIAIIDDDEYPARDWLKKMYRCIKEYGADGVLGPVLPDFPEGAPRWLKRSGLCNRPRNFTGSPITGKDLRTGNVLFRRSAFEKDDKWFDPARGLTGGSDGEFLSRQIKRGHKYIWCDDALVFETVPEDRWQASFYLKRQYRIGTMTGRMIRHSWKISAFLKTCLLFLGYASLLPFSMLAGKHVCMKVLTKAYYNAGCILSFLKLTHLKQRE
jgi:glycosyltransferase involved in cell wall biosynthesis